jgi:hypothetical protein
MRQAVSEIATPTLLVPISKPSNRPPLAAWTSLARSGSVTNFICVRLRSSTRGQSKTPSFLRAPLRLFVKGSYTKGRVRHCWWLMQCCQRLHEVRPFHRCRTRVAMLSSTLSTKLPKDVNPFSIFGPPRRCLSCSSARVPDTVPTYVDPVHSLRGVQPATKIFIFQTNYS